MKTFLIALLTFSFAHAVVAQHPSDSLYGFQQHISPGMKKAGTIDANGHFTKKEPPALNQYTLLFSTDSSARIEPLVVWLNGQAFSAILELSPAVSGLPEHLQSAMLYKLVLTPAASKNAKGKALARKHAAVFHYRRNGKEHYGVLKKFAVVPPQVRQ